MPLGKRRNVLIDSNLLSFRLLAGRMGEGNNKKWRRIRDREGFFAIRIFPHLHAKIPTRAGATLHNPYLFKVILPTPISFSYDLIFFPFFSLPNLLLPFTHLLSFSFLSSSFVSFERFFSFVC